MVTGAIGSFSKGKATDAMGDNKSRAVKPQINASKNLMLMRINTSFITYGGVLLLTVILATLLRLSPLHGFD